MTSRRAHNAISEYQGQRNVDRKPMKCVHCLQRPRELPYTKCHACRTPTLRSASMKAWRIRKRMQLARELRE